MVGAKPVQVGFRLSPVLVPFVFSINEKGALHIGKVVSLITGWLASVGTGQVGREWYFSDAIPRSGHDGLL